jgi:hypothetical protein
MENMKPKCTMYGPCNIKTMVLNGFDASKVGAEVVVSWLQWM